MTTITKEQAQKIIDAADEVITALAGTNDDVHPDNSTKMTQLYDDLNDHYAPPEVVRELARIALASLEENEFIPKNLDKALGVVGVALPESKEEFNFQTERWIQRLIDRVIRYADEFKEQPTPVVPEDISGIIERFQYQADHLSDWHHIDEHSCKVNRRDLMTALEFMDSCRSAMLNGGKS
ncbi:hypothetical protein MXG88_003349 [Salmonella enterica]|nr:hypothetical protein [Salmonella enterica]EGY4512350.1 hypothetical protein [Salmonella enterica]EGY4554815.1 hypothetical protein [Salmonella enterica]EGY4700610.1 hypothetical protein [Salmonella enterica]EGY5274290.1 hypothetical protein [Salmonella enterica]